MHSPKEGSRRKGQHEQRPRSWKSHRQWGPDSVLQSTLGSRRLTSSGRKEPESPGDSALGTVVGLSGIPAIPSSDEVTSLTQSGCSGRPRPVEYSCSTRAGLWQRVQSYPGLLVNAHLCGAREMPRSREGAERRWANSSPERHFLSAPGDSRCLAFKAQSEF